MEAQQQPSQKGGIEGGLISLLETIVSSQQAAMQGQQVLMLEALTWEALRVDILAVVICVVPVT